MELDRDRDGEERESGAGRIDEVGSKREQIKENRQREEERELRSVEERTGKTASGEGGREGERREME